MLLESVYQSKEGLNETQRDANVTALLIDQWFVRGIKKGGFCFISANALNLQLRLVSMNTAEGHGYTKGAHRHRHEAR